MTKSPELPETDDDREFLRMIAWFAQEKDDPTRYVGWDAHRLFNLRPDFYFAWLNYETAGRNMRSLSSDMEREYEVRG